VKGAEVDAAARNVLRERGFGPQFKHGTGHGVGYSAISANAKPRIHPRSEDTLEPGMTFNIEPAIYFEGYGGIRHCDLVTITESGFELLTPFQCRVSELALSS
jgi:Xaa-Pro aminopeptidase